MFDEVSSFNDYSFLGKFIDCKCCWIALTETGSNEDQNKRGFPSSFHHKNLNVLFRSATHISTASNRHIDKKNQMLPFPAEVVKVPGCFTASQLNIECKTIQRVDEYYLDKQKNCVGLEFFLCDKYPGFIGDQFLNRLLLIIFDQQFSQDELRRLKKSWNASDVVHCDRSENVDIISGSEFQSVVIFMKASLTTIDALNMAVCRAQYEVGVIVFKDIAKWDEEEELEAYLYSLKFDHVRVYRQFMSDPPTNRGWLSPRDDDRTQWEWWLKKLEIFMTGREEDVVKIFKAQPVYVRIQLSAAFPSLFKFPTKQNSALPRKLFRPKIAPCVFTEEH